MTAITFPLSSSPGEKGQEGGGRLINCYAEPLGSGAASPAVIKRAPGFTNFSETAEDTFRGMIEVDGHLYVAFDGTLLDINSSGVEATEGALAGDDFCFFARNNAATPDIVIVSPSEGAFVIDTVNGGVDNYPDGDLPAPNSICFGLGYFFPTIGDGRCFASGINSTSINANDFITAEGRPDSLLRGWFWGEELYLGGGSSIEVWGAPINDTGFPLNRRTIIPRGIVSNRAVTGFEEGFEHGIAFTATNSVVYMLNGYNPVRISTPDVERAISRLADKSVIEMTSYIVDGHPHIVVSCPSFTWVYDLATQVWHERKSYLDTRWRVAGTLWAFNKWLSGDTDSGNIVEIKGDAYTEAGSPLIFEAHSAPGQAFPNRIGIPRADFNFVTGTGVATGIDPNETDPKVEISWSDDGGNIFGSPRIRSLGRQAITKGPITVNQTGSTGQKGRRWKVAVSDPCYVGLLGGDMQVEKRAA